MSPGQGKAEDWTRWHQSCALPYSLLFQALYEELLRGSAEIYGSAYASKAKKAIESISEERRRKVGVHCEERRRKVGWHCEEHWRKVDGRHHWFRTPP